MPDALRGEAFKPYRDAIRSILQKKPVPQLEKIRRGCNLAAGRILERHRKATMRRLPLPKGRWYNPLHVMISYSADVENRILMGEARPEDSYAFERGAPSAEKRFSTRMLCLEILTELVEVDGSLKGSPSSSAAKFYAGMPLRERLGIVKELTS